MLDRREIDAALADTTRLLTQAQAVPYLTDGKLDGFRLYSVMPLGFFDKIGLQTNDVLQRINGVEPTTANPALGLRAIRFCLAEPQLFLVQLRAILRASHHGRIRLLIPMLAHAQEIEQTLSLIELARFQLRESRQKFDAVEVGGMIEIPAAALALGPFLRRLDFLSIGTNDLIQYTLAIDRTDDSVAHLYDPLHPAVLHLIAHTIQAANRGGTPVAVCGEMAGETQLTRLLLGFGLRNFSMHAQQLLAIKERVLRMMDKGLVEEVASLLALDRPLSTAARQAVGYAEVIDHLQGGCDLAHAVEAIKINTRQLAKAQRTWFRRFRTIEWIDLALGAEVPAVADSLMERFA